MAIEEASGVRQQVKVRRLIQEVGVTAVQLQISGPFVLNAQSASVIIDEAAPIFAVHHVARAVDDGVAGRQSLVRRVLVEQLDGRAAGPLRGGEEREILANSIYRLGGSAAHGKAISVYVEVNRRQDGSQLLPS